MRMPVIESFPL